MKKGVISQMFDLGNMVLRLVSEAKESFDMAVTEKMLFRFGRHLQG